MRIRVIFKILEQEAVLWHPTARKWKGIGGFLKFGQRIAPANIAFFLCLRGWRFDCCASRIRQENAEDTGYGNSKGFTD